MSSGIQASLPGRYATALFEIAAETKAIDAVEGDLARLRQALDDSADLARLTTSPLVSRSDALKAIAATGEALGLSATTRNFLGVLAQNRRLGQLSAIIRTFRLLAAAHRGETTAEVASAHPLDAAQVDALKAALRQRLGRDVAVDLTVDPSLLGGLMVRIGSQMIDSSIKTRLNALAHAMKG
ncbi:F0F1 ATP synthase subunit delta [Sphingomonas sp.]|uniref:F0F1 ATP synthase subunit delta n=1 Tax=Sphingomonas sp. TaxID=28214 RepID=UPI001D5E1E63|nr:F0F1 ATP synthase subunit delta [Sphingomonas sp.]MBX9797560.1 F0F1 ATP synthase subunit delta [Sphingomonas sp.]